MSDPIREIEELFKVRGKQYGYCLVSFAGIPTDSNPILLRGSIRFEKGEPLLNEFRKYQSLVLSKEYIPPGDGMTLIKNLYSGSLPIDIKWQIKEKYDISSAQPNYQKLPFQSRESSFNNEWPASVFYLKYPQQRVNEPYGPLIAANLPIASEPKWAIAKWIGIDPDVSDCYNGIAIFSSDFRARITKIVLHDKEVRFHVEVQESSIDDLIAKAEIGSGKDAHEVEINRTNDVFSLSFDATSQSFRFYLVDKKSGDVIDWASINLGWIERDRRLEFVTPSQQIEHLILNGESKEMEFKEEVSDGFRLIQTVVAFANTDGGTILIGVDDTGKIIGTDVKKVQQKIIEWIEKKCDPPIELHPEKITIQNKDILLINVPKGDSKPYLHRDNGIVYVRRGSTDRPATRSEILTLTQNRYMPGIR